MKRLDKGPKIELSKLKPGNLKVPSPVQDLWNDLRSQRLLPVVAILIIGLVAIPLLLGGSSHPKPEAGANPTAPGEASPSDLVVSKFAPGLRDYRRRFGSRTAKDPFETPHAATKGSGSKGGEAAAAPSPELLESTEPSGGAEAGSGEGTEPSAPEPPLTEPSEEGAGEAPKEEVEEVPTEATVDLIVTTLHLDGKRSESARHAVEQLTAIPSKSVPALTYVGPSQDGRSAMMAVSSEVTDLLGKSSCVVKGEPCQLLALKLGEPETLVFGPRGLTYRVEIKRIGTLSVKPQGGDGTNSSAAKGDGKTGSSSEGSVGRHAIAIG